MGFFCRLFYGSPQLLLFPVFSVLVYPDHHRRLAAQREVPDRNGRQPTSRGGRPGGLPCYTKARNGGHRVFFIYSFVNVVAVPCVIFKQLPISFHFFLTIYPMLRVRTGPIAAIITEYE